MKKLLIIFSLAAIASLVACQKPAKSGDSNSSGADGKKTASVAGMPYNISIVNATDGDFYLTNYDTGDTLLIASAADSKVTFSGAADEPFFARMVTKGRRVGFIVEQGDITIDWETGIATGTPLNEKFNAIDSVLENIEQQYNVISALAKSKEITAEQAKERGDKVTVQLQDEFMRIYNDNRDNAIGPWALYNYFMTKQGITSAEIQSLLDKAPKRYASMSRMKKALANVKQIEVTKEGNMFTDFAVTCDDGKTRRLSDYVGKGSYTLVDFWAGWCRDCRIEIESTIKPLYKEYADKMTFLGVAVWESPEDTRKAINDMAIPWEVIVGNSKLDEPADLYGVLGIPTIVVFDPEGRIVARGLAAEDLTKKVDQLMAQ